MTRCCILAGFFAACATTVRAEVKSVVVIFGGESRTPAYQAYEPVLRQSLEQASSGGLDYYEEYVDNTRFPGPGAEKQLAEYLRGRYAGKGIDLVITVDPTALRFMVKHRDAIYPRAPVVFIGVRTTTVAGLTLPSDFKGVPTDLDPAPTIRLALALRPNARELVFVAGTAELDRGWEAVVHATPLPRGVTLRTLKGLAIDAIERELAKLGSGAVVVMGSFRRDGAGQTFPGGAAVLQRLRKVTGAPIFYMYDTGVGTGAAGTFSVAQGSLPANAAAIGKQILGGVPVGAVRPPEPSVPVPVVDWRELRHWGMDEARLPPGTVVRFRDPSFWDQYRHHVIGIALLIVLETVLVAALLLQRGRRRRAEESLRQGERKMQLAANAAQLDFWDLDLGRQDVATADRSDSHPGDAIAPDRGDLEAFLDAIHVEDRHAVRRGIEAALGGEDVYEGEYRVVGDDGATRWFAGSGRVEHVDGTRRLRGVTLDITRRKSAELDAQHQRSELTHLSRVTMVGELSSSIAHELNQPLMAILSNAQAARLFINQETIDLVELGAILDDIVENDKRAGEIIWGLRKMLKKEDAAREWMSMNQVVREVLRLMRSELMNRGIIVETRFDATDPEVSGDRMQLQQVVLNLVLNACDAMAASPRSERVVVIRTDSSGGEVRVSVADRGSGIAGTAMKSIFMPFFTTKKHGLGLGLSVCTSIVKAHGGELRATNNAERGATFSFSLAARAEAIA